MTQGRLVVVEGGEGSGKSTQVERLVARLAATGREALGTFEPGATARGARLRDALLADDSPLDARAELFMLLADRAQHVAEVVRPALARGAVVVCDRFTPSTLAYQGVGRGLGIEVVARAAELATAGVVADLVVVLDVDEATATARRPVASDRFEAAGAEFHACVRAAYRELAPRYGWVVVDGSPDVEQVGGRVWALVNEHAGA